ncbi:MAG: thiamine-phosphate kinase, partial [Muribaculaceae bacterium]|nr:thiamine-phosphate kinase [Muribaculaceae bacterium]
RYVPLNHLGYKSAIANFSDVYAIGGTPKDITVSLGISNRFTLEHIETLYDGIRTACDMYGVDLVGGDTSASVTGLIISITCIGECEKGKAIRRSGAKPTDIICVSGDFGAAYMGLRLLERENRVSASAGLGFKPDFSGKEYILERQLKPEARRDIVEALKKAGITPTSMMDVSDGLSSELLHICNKSNTGCRIYEDKIPIDYQTALMAEEMNMNVITAAMNGGEDYELLFTVPLTEHDRIENIKGVKMIGYITEPSLGCAMITRDGQEFPLKAQGWNAFSPDCVISKE